MRLAVGLSDRMQRLTKGRFPSFRSRCACVYTAILRVAQAAGFYAGTQLVRSRNVGGS
jgi:hypothetical protein